MVEGWEAPIVYKVRRLSATELLEIETVLQRVMRLKHPGLCAVRKYAVSEHQLHLLLEYVGGGSLNHLHDDHWNNEPAFMSQLAAVPVESRIRWLSQVIDILIHVHDAGLLFPDLKPEQFVLRSQHELVAVDVDSLILKGGHCAHQSRWTSPTLEGSDDASSRRDFMNFLRLAHEVLTLRHLREGDLPKHVKYHEVHELIRSWLPQTQTTSAEVALAQLDKGLYEFERGA
jgi:hypothetical protein